MKPRGEPTTAVQRSAKSPARRLVPHTHSAPARTSPPPDRVPAARALPSLSGLLRRVAACQICAADLPLGPRPVLQMDRRARILIASQAPGRKAHASGIPFSDASGDRLREWMGVSPEQFYDPALFAIVPMGLCFPGTGTSGDLPPRVECAAHWRKGLLAQLPALQLTLVIGQYALAWHLPGTTRSVTDAVRAWRAGWPQIVPLPHPSPRNNLWLQRNPWFAQDLLPVLQDRIAGLLTLSA